MYDLNDSEGYKGADASSEDEPYDLTTADDDTTTKRKTKKKKSSIAFAKGGRKTVSKRYLPEAIDEDNSDDDDSSLDFDDMDRMSDDGADGSEGRRKKKRRVEEDGISEGDPKEAKRREKKLAMVRCFKFQYKLLSGIYCIGFCSFFLFQNLAQEGTAEEAKTGEKSGEIEGISTFLFFKCHA